MRDSLEFKKNAVAAGEQLHQLVTTVYQEAKENNGLTQTKLAGMVGVTQSNISKLLARKNLSVVEAASLLAAMGKKLSFTITHLNTDTPRD